MAVYTEIIQATDNPRKYAFAKREYKRSGYLVSNIGPEEKTGIPERDGPVIPTSIDKTMKIISGVHYDALAVGTDNQTIVKGQDLLRPDRDERFRSAGNEREQALEELFAKALELYQKVDELGNEVIFRAAWTLESADGEIKKVVAIEIKALINQIEQEEIEEAFKSVDGELPPATSTGPIIDVASLISRKKSKLVRELAIRNLGEVDWVELDPESRSYLVEKFIRQCVLPHFWLKWIIDGKIARNIATTEEGYEQVALPLRTLNQVIFKQRTPQ